MTTRLIILDRDGVINRDSPNGITSPDEWRALPGSLEAIARLCRGGYRTAVITNQSGVAKGRYSINTLNRIHQKMLNQLQPLGGQIDAFFFCPHDDKDNCACRKPKPGMFIELRGRLNCDLRDAFAVGDRVRDLRAAHAAGARAVLVKTGGGRDTARAIKQCAQLANTPIYDDLAAFVHALINEDA